MVSVVRDPLPRSVNHKREPQVFESSMQGLTKPLMEIHGELRFCSTFDWSILLLPSVELRQYLLLASS